MFINMDCRIQLDQKTPVKKRHWYCPIIAVNFRESTVYLCQITYSIQIDPIITHFQIWDSHWDLLCAAVARDCLVPASWKIQPLLFIPQERHAELTKKLSKLQNSEPAFKQMPTPKVIYLESVTPWNYPQYDRKTLDIK